MSFGYHLKKLTEAHGAQTVEKTVEESLASGKLKPRDVHLQDLAESFLGRSKTEQRRKLNLIATNRVHLLEAAEAVDASAFSNITGQLLVTEIKQKYNAPEFIGDKLMRKIPNPGGNLGTHKIPYLSDVIDKASTLEQGQPYPQTRFNESWVTMPSPEKRGLICTVTMEMLLSDLTGQAQDSAASIGRSMRYQKEERQLRVVLGLTNNYVFNGNSLNTYIASSVAPGNYSNKLLNETVSNYTHINDIEQKFWQMVDPITGRRIQVRPSKMLCMPAKRYDIKRILHATEVRDATTGVHNVSANPIDNQYEVLTSTIAEQLLLDAGVSSSVIKERIWAGDFEKAFFYREVQGFETVTAPAGNPLEFMQDIVLAVKCSEYGVPGVYDPRYVVWSTSEGS